jgi:hypothetical protein
MSQADRLAKAEQKGIIMQRIPYGYRMITRKKKQTLVPNDDELKIVEALFTEIWKLSLRKLSAKYGLSKSKIWDILIRTPFYWDGCIKRHGKVVHKVEPVVKKPKWADDPMKLTMVWKMRR